MKYERVLFLLAVMLIGLQSWAVTETVLHNFAGGAYSEYGGEIQPHNLRSTRLPHRLKFWDTGL